MGGCIDNFSHFFYWQGPWKLLGNPRDTGTTASWSGPDSPGKLPAPPKLMLVNIEEDPSEKTDRSSQEPEVFKKLKAAQDDWAARLRYWTPSCNTPAHWPVRRPEGPVAQVGHHR